MNCQRCGYSPAIMMERDQKKAIVCGKCILDQFIEWENEQHGK